MKKYQWALFIGFFFFLPATLLYAKEYPECDFILESPRDECKMQLAKERGDPSICNDVSELSKKSFCFFDIAMETKDASFCKDIPSDDSHVRNDCFKYIALEKDDPSVCQWIIGDGTKDSCFEGIAKKRKDYSVCNNISELSTRTSCLFSIAVETKNPSVCKDIPSDYSGNRDDCLKKLALEKNDPSICEDIGYDPQKALCISDIAIKIEDASLCDGAMKDDCVRQIVVLKNDLSGCKNINNPGSKDECFDGIAVKRADSLICELIDNIHIKDLCLVRIAERTGDIFLCKKVSSQEGRDVCLMDLAAKQNNDFYCADIIGFHQREYCLERVGYSFSGIFKERTIIRLVTLVVLLGILSFLFWFPHNVYRKYLFGALCGAIFADVVYLMGYVLWSGMARFVRFFMIGPFMIFGGMFLDTPFHWGISLFVSALIGSQLAVGKWKLLSFWVFLTVFFGGMLILTFNPG